MSDTVGIGLIGAGFLAETRARCYSRASGGAIVAVASRTREKAETYAARHGVPNVADDADALLAREDVQLVDLCVPNHLHRPLCERAAAAGKHVVCTKPLAAYVGQGAPEEALDDLSGVPRAEMLEVATAEARAMVDACERAGVHLMYGENWVYAPSIQRAAALLATSGAPLLEMRGWESHSGSHSPYSKRWRYTGGGALLRLGAHPLGAMLHLKRAAGVRPVAVSAEVADLTRVEGMTERGTRVATGWVDVESWGCLVVSFSDGARGVVYGSDVMLGGMESRLELLAADCHLKCNLSPNDLLRAYAPEASVFEGAYVMEKLDSGAGWTTPIPDEDWSSGHQAMCADFVDAAREGRPALADGALGLEVTRVVYAGYLAAAEGRRVTLAELA
jgi:predicted dehydrogenase